MGDLNLNIAEDERVRFSFSA